MSSSLNPSLLDAVSTPGAGIRVTKEPQKNWAVSLSAVNACLTAGRQHPRTMNGRTPKPYAPSPAELTMVAVDEDRRSVRLHQGLVAGAIKTEEPSRTTPSTSTDEVVVAVDGALTRSATL